MQGDRRQGEQGRLNQVDTGDMAGMPKDVKPPSASPPEHHSHKRQGMLHLPALHSKQVELCGIAKVAACSSHTCLLQKDASFSYLVRSTASH